MESEKVKEIKECLEVLNEYGETYITKDKTQRKFVKYADILTLINELESENERLQEKNGALSCDLDYINQKLTNAEIEVDDYKDRIAELEKGNEALSFAVKRGFNDCQKKTLKQFAERLKEQMNEGEYMGEKYKLSVFRDIDIDETLKEFIGDKND